MQRRNARKGTRPREGRKRRDLTPLPHFSHRLNVPTTGECPRGGDRGFAVDRGRSRGRTVRRKATPTWRALRGSSFDSTVAREKEAAGGEKQLLNDAKEITISQQLERLCRSAPRPQRP